MIKRRITVNSGQMGMLIQNAQEQQDRLYFMQQIEYNQNGVRARRNRPLRVQ